MFSNNRRYPNVPHQWLAGMAGPRQSRFTPATTTRLRRSTCAYVMLLMIVAITLIRPMDLLLPLKDVPLYQIALVAALAANVSGIRDQLRLSRLRERPVTVCVLGVYVSIVMSHVSHMYLTGATDIGFIPVMLLYLLIVSLVDSPERLQQFLRIVTLAGTAIVSLCLLDYLNVIDVRGITHLNRENESVGELMNWRMRGVGIFEDPNDLATLVVFLGILSAWSYRNSSRSTTRCLWLISLVMLCAALVCTRSRGGLLAAAAAGSVLAYWRYGKTVVVCTAMCGLALLPILSGRTAGISGDDSTAFERVLLWREGLHAMMSPDFVFGIGAGLYEELDGLVAHNSFIHAFVELGFVGGTCFIGWFLFVALAMFRVVRRRTPCTHPQIAILFPFVAAFLTGWCVSLLSLSRCYAPSTILVVGSAAAYVNLLEDQLNPPQKLTCCDPTHLKILLTVSSIALVGFYCFTRVVT
ncbi:MAG: O-antigen ligase family protein [Planctomycetaceae bacterium]